MKNLIKIICCLIMLFNGILFAEIISVNDKDLRNAIERLNIAGYIKTPINTWPILWSSIEDDIQDIDESKIKNKDVKHAYKTVINRYEHSKQSLKYSLSLAGATYPTPFYFKDDIIRNYLKINPSITFKNNIISGQLSLLFDYNENKNIMTWTDNTYISKPIGNFMLSFGTETRFWGPGNESSLILSNNAHGIPSLTIKRIKHKPFNNKFLHYLGPWDFRTIIGQLEGNRGIPNTKYFANRFSFKPHTQLEIGLSRAAQWGGNGRENNLITFLNMLIGNDHTGHPEDSNRGLNRNTEPGNQLAGFDFTFNTTINSLPTSLYGDLIAEDSVSRFNIIPQPFKYLQLYGLKLYLKENTSIFYEFTNTITKQLLSFHPYTSSSYNNSIYSSGYRYYGDTIGHPIDTNSASYSLGIEKVMNTHKFQYIFRRIYSKIDTTKVLETNNKDRILSELYVLQHDLSYKISSNNVDYFFNIMLDRYQYPSGKKQIKVYSALGVDINF